MKNIKFLIAPLLASLLAITGGQSMAAEQTTQPGTAHNRCQAHDAGFCRL